MEQPDLSIPMPSMPTRGDYARRIRELTLGGGLVRSFDDDKQLLEDFRAYKGSDVLRATVRRAVNHMPEGPSKFCLAVALNLVKEPDVQSTLEERRRAGMEVSGFSYSTTIRHERSAAWELSLMIVLAITSTDEEMQRRTVMWFTKGGQWVNRPEWLDVD